jgi:hypothetical protein
LSTAVTNAPVKAPLTRLVVSLPSLDSHKRPSN